MNNLIGPTSDGSGVNHDRAATNAGAFRHVPGKGSAPSLANHRPSLRPASASTPTMRKIIKPKA